MAVIVNGTGKWYCILKRKKINKVLYSRLKGTDGGTSYRVTALQKEIDWCIKR